jgi:RNA polymerase subunit RPABC4/transcription elongation factor Spt4
VYKECNNEVNPYWDDITTLKLCYVDTLDEYFEMSVSCDETNSVSKHITASSLCEAELSQLPLHDFEINTENDANIYNDDLKLAESNATIFYDPLNPSYSLLDRLLADKGKCYSIGHVDESLCQMVRSFSIDGTTIYDALIGEIAEQFGCVFLFDSKTRTISAYDLNNKCNDCGKKIDISEVCPYCGSTNITYGYGKDTAILIDTNNLANKITVDTNKDTIKNCFRLSAGDDEMTAAIMQLNPNGSQYIYNFNEYTKKDMSSELLAKLDAYDTLYDSLKENYDTLVQSYYDKIVEKDGYETTMCPTVTIAETDVNIELAKLTTANLSPIALSWTTASKSIVDNAILSYVEVVLNPSYKAEVVSSTYDSNTSTWVGKFKVSFKGDSTISATSSQDVTILTNADKETFIKQKIDKAMNSYKVEDSDNRDYSLYSLFYLKTYDSAYTEAINVMDQVSTYDKMQIVNFDSIRASYYAKLQSIESNMAIRDGQVSTVSAEIDTLKSQMDSVKSQLDLETFINDNTLYLEFCSFLRCDEYKNENIISEDLDAGDNKKLFDRAKEFLSIATQELIKASTPQHSCSIDMNNILANVDFSCVANDFLPGNFVRIKQDGTIYRLRLLKYEIDYNSLSKGNAEFSDAIVAQDFMSDAQSVISSARSMSTSYGYVQKQADSGQIVYNDVSDWKKNGLDVKTMAIVSDTEKKNVVYDGHGFLFREYSDETKDYLPEQSKFTSNSWIITDDNWEHTRTAMGRYTYVDPDTSEVMTTYGIDGETIVGDLLLGKGLKIRNSNSKFTVDDNGMEVSSINGVSKLLINPNSNNIFRITKNDVDKMYIDSDGNVNINDLFAHNGTFSGTIDCSTGTISGANLVGGSFKSSNFSTVNETGAMLDCNNGTLNIYGALDEGGGIYMKTLLRSADGILAISTSYSNETGYPEATYINPLSLATNTVGCNRLDTTTAFFESGGTIFGSDLSISAKTLNISGTKKRIVKTQNYGTRSLYCLETPTPIFSDFGNAKLDADGLCYIYLDDIFGETIDMDCNYNVSLTKYGQGELWVEDRQHDYFVVKGTPNMEFGWTINAVQREYESYRLEEFTNEKEEKEPDYGVIGANYYENFEKEILNNEESN